MTTPINARDVKLQQTSPRVLNVASNYITLVSPNLEAKYTADNNPNPSVLEITTILSGDLKGQVVFEVTGLLPNTALVLDSQNSNKLLLDPNTFATDIVTVTAKLTFESVEYVSVPVTAYRNYASIVTRLSRAFDNVSADVNGNSYTLPGSNYLELYNGTTKLTTNITFGPASTTKSGLTCTVNSTTGEVTFSQAAANSWTTDQETFTLTATRNFIPYTVSYTINKIREGGTGVDATPPPTPTNFAATAAINTIVISHDTASYTQGSGHAKTVLYGKVFNTGDVLTPFNPADVIAEFTGSVYTLASEPGTTWRLWAKWRSNDGFLSTIPAGGTNGITVTTGQDVGKLLEVLSGEITESQLYSTLTSRIDLIDTPNTGLVDKTNSLITTYGTTASAAESALLAGQAKADAIIAKGIAEGYATLAATESEIATAAKNAAQGSETNASQYANAALSSASDAAGSASTATTQAGLATDAKNAAQGSETNASQYANAALSSASDAAGSASTATTQAGLATSAKNAAEGASTSASQYANAALSSATDAAGSASTATTQSGLATEAKNAATLSETNASINASAAVSSASNAAGSASTAATQAGLATDAKNAASGFSTSASQSATAAASSASSAAGSASTATTQAGIATAAQSSASGYATTAGVHSQNSANSASDASGYATSAASSLQQVQSTIRGTSLGLPLEQWALNGQGITTITDGKVGTKALRLSGTYGYPNQGNYVPIDKTKKYRIKFWARPSSNAAGLLYFSLRQFTNDSGDTTGLPNGGRDPYKPSGRSRAQHIATYGDTWGEYNYVWSSADWQAGTKFVQPEFLDNYSGQVGYWDIQAFTFTDVTQTEELTAAVQTLATTTAGTDGLTAQYTVKTNTAGHVAGFGLSSQNNLAGVNTSSFGITADRFFIAPPAVLSATAPTINLYNGFTWVDTSVNPVVTRYRSGSTWVTTPPVLPFVVQAAPVIGTGTEANPQIPAGVYIDAAFIKNATITTAKIADLAVDNAQIANGAITNAKINDLSADKITAGFISADRINADTITADKLNVDNLAAINANMGTVTAGKMQSTDNKFVIDLTNKYISISV